MEENKLSQADFDEKIGEFWDTHDFTEFDTDAPDSEFEVTCSVPVSLELLGEIEKLAAKRGVNVGELVGSLEFLSNHKVVEDQSPRLLYSATLGRSKDYSQTPKGLRLWSIGDSNPPR